MKEHASGSVTALKIEQRCFDVPGLMFMPHWHHQLEIIRVTEGVLRLGIIETSHILKPGDLAIINPNEIHSVTRESDVVMFEVYQFDLFGMTENLADVQQKFLNQMFHHHKFQLVNIMSEAQHYKQFFEDMKAADEAGQIDVLEGIGRLMLIDLLRHSKYRIEDEAQYKMYKHSLSQLKPPVSMMLYNYDERITLEMLADMSNLSVIHFSRIFKTLMQYTPIEYLNTIRVIEASRLLRDTELSVIEIALQTGLKDTNYFSRFFKHYMALTPTTYRKKFGTKSQS